MRSTIIKINDLNCKLDSFVSFCDQSNKEISDRHAAVESKLKLIERSKKAPWKQIADVRKSLADNRQFIIDRAKEVDKLQAELRKDIEHFESNIRTPDHILTKSERAYCLAVLKLSNYKTPAVLRQKDIARHAGLSVVTISAAQKSLVEKGIIKATHKYAPHPTIKGKVTRSHTEIEFLDSEAGL